MTDAIRAARAPTLAGILGDEGLRLFFPLSALHAALWPLLWAVVNGFALPFDGAIPPGLWHAHEMLFGSFGAAVIGFITTAIPEWTDSRRLQGHALFALAALWGIGRVAGLTGADGAAVVAAVADTAWLAALPVYVAAVSWRKRTSRLIGVLLWLSALAVSGAVVHAAFVIGDVERAQAGLHAAGLVLLGLLGLVLARITVPVTNLVLDPSQSSSPYRPHPGRLNLAPGLVAIALAGEIAGLSPAVSAYLFVAAGAAFLDRVAESFIGRAVFRAEILALAGSSLMAGAGLLLIGASRLGAGFAETPALHLALMGGLGLGVLAVFAIAGLFHTGRTLPLPTTARLAIPSLIGAVALRVLPELGVLPVPPGPPHALAALLWAAAFLLWLKVYWPFLSKPRVDEAAAC
ncbi:NnrS family protein (plasmid) [Azospirillum brasilense]|uniref:NnrS family protein n=1 Tax=Azospirillum brasilense TaxID=192 RepID=A0A4D8R5K0_AZOBR|nr:MULTISPECIES: NnrS family protein [Azospirillum]MDW7554493.1 NnrS family protein [Azospirillum brasilense]MDW7593988.1 NnrS family protein [Azospirillum brasilense]MDW7632090.1 NnrS family protein [Azospirillum brasilense]MDX5950042.1 NnrS family protein [Azospirillum brasilense]OPH12733.1 short-chain dehydrogenase [Azospirillum brasilense]